MKRPLNPVSDELKLGKTGTSEDFETFYKTLGDNRKPIVDVAEKLKKQVKKDNDSYSHSCMQLMTAIELMDEGCGEVDVEYKLETKEGIRFVVDVYGKSDDGRTAAVEVETNGTQDYYEDDAVKFLRKIIKYSRVTTYFGLTVPLGSLPPIPSFLMRQSRSQKESERAADITNRGYRNGQKPFDIYDIDDSKVSSIFLVDLKEPSIIRIGHGIKNITDYIQPVRLSESGIVLDKRYS